MAGAKSVLDALCTGELSLTETAAALARAYEDGSSVPSQDLLLVNQFMTEGKLSPDAAARLRNALTNPGPTPPTADFAPPPVRPGTVLRDRFVIESLVGSGGMGVVYRALDRRREEAKDRNPYVAVKLLGAEFRNHPDALIALQREARRMQELNHPNIASVFDFDRDQAQVFLTMELLEGQSLDRVILRHAGGGLPPAEAIRIVGSVANALGHAHSKGLIHSDLKPANIFLTDQGDVKVFDFGIARVAKTSTQLAGAALTVFDAGKLGAWTNAYASPEQQLDSAIPDARDDVYALGLVAYELLTGRHPFAGKSSIEAQINGIKPPRVAGLSRKQNEALLNAVEFKREKRTASALEFARALYGVDDGGGPLATDVAFAGNKQPAVKTVALRRKLRASAAGVVLLGWLALAGVYLYSREERSLPAPRVPAPAERAGATRDTESAAESSTLAATGRTPAVTAEAMPRTREAAGVPTVSRAAPISTGPGLVAGAESAPGSARVEHSPNASATEKAEAAGRPADPGNEHGQPATETLYRWADKDGAVHFGPVPPPEYAKSAVPVVDLN